MRGGGTPEGHFLRGGEHLRDAFAGMYHLPGADDTGPKGGYETRLLQTDDSSDEGDGVEV